MARATTRSSRVDLTRAIVVAWALTISACAAPSAETVLLNGKIFTANPAQPWATALAIRGERIVAIGGDAAVEAGAGPSTRRLDLAGRVVVPGLNDAHLALTDATPASVRLLGAQALANGVTSIQVFSVSPVAGTVRAFLEAGLPLRVRILRMPQPDATGGNRDSRPFFPPQPTPRIDVRGMGFALGAEDDERMRQAVGWAYGSEDPLAIASRDAQATAAYVDALERHGAADVWKAKRPRLEQLVAVDPGLLARLPKLGVVLVEVPGPGAPLRSVLDAGVPLGLGSGGALRGFDLLRLATAAALGDERLSMEQAVTAYSHGSAIGEFEDQDKGRLEVGALADLAVLSRDPFAATEEELRTIRAVLTMIGGRPVYDVLRP